MFVAGYLDSWFILADERLFGCQPSILFMQRFSNLALSEVLYASYFSYYLMISGIGLALLLRDRRQFFHYLSVVSFVFYCCYLVYIALPVMGPRILFRDLAGFHLEPEVAALVQDPYFPESVQSGLFFQIMKFIYHVFESPGAAFPSSHVAIAWCTVYFSFRYLPRIRWWHAAVATLLSISTVYGRYHYVVDVFAGLATAAVLTPLGNRLYWRFQRQSGEKASPAAASTPAPDQRSRS
jgi:membrane-associated phospholipid phosphatase